MPKETATERRAREAQEARIALEKWEVEKPMRLLKALARLPNETRHFDDAHSCVYMHANGMRYVFSIPDLDTIVGYVDELTSWTMEYIEGVISDYEAKRQKDVYMLALRAELLSKMTDEEKEALGL